MSEAPEDIASIAARGLADPSSVTADEVQSLCGWILPRADEPPAPPPPVMSDAVRAELMARRDELKRKADKRRNQPGFAANVEELDSWVAEIDADLGGTQPA